MRGFRRDVADHEAVSGAAETSIGDQRDVIAQALADERGGDRQHLAHARSACGAFEADDDHVTSEDLARLHRSETCVFGIEHSCGAFEVRAAVACQLDDAAFRGEVAVQDREATAGLQRLRDRAHHVLWAGSGQPVQFGEERTPGDRGHVLQHPGGAQLLRDQCVATEGEHFRRGVAATRFEIGDDWRGGCGLELLQPELDTGFVRDRQQVHGAVRGSGGGRHRARRVA